MGEEAQKEFIRLYGGILRLRNILTSFDDFDGNRRPDFDSKPKTDKNKEPKKPENWDDF